MVRYRTCQLRFAIRAERDYVLEEDFLKAARKIAEGKKLEGSLDYEKV